MAHSFAQFQQSFESRLAGSQHQRPTKMPDWVSRALVVTSSKAAYFRQSTGQAGLGAQPLGLQFGVGAHEAEQVVFTLALAALALGVPTPANESVDEASRAARRILFMEKKVRLNTKQSERSQG